MVMTVASAKAERMVRCISASVSASTAEVASSIITSEQRESSARAMQRSWRWPVEKLAPSSATSSSSERTACARCTRCSAAHIACAVCSPSGSRLSRTVPEKSTGSCGMTATADLCTWSGTSAMSRPSMRIAPVRSGGATSRVSATTRLDLPEPVRPTTPTFSPGSTVAVRPCSTSGSPSRYLSRRSRSSTRPCGAYSPTHVSKTRASAPCTSVPKPAWPLKPCSPLCGCATSPRDSATVGAGATSPASALAASWSRSSGGCLPPACACSLSAMASRSGLSCSAV
mmetsp:Transcript_4924/g.10691  ORF Transcript_4924/g.10691 Transcript_4924/m.10691 type:complete len:285 (-) Transcript_4924:3510-4364(-)